MPSAAERSPSPPPPPPTALTPGHRAQDFLTLYDLTLTKTLSSITYDSFSSCFPQIAARAPDALKSIHSDMVSRLGGFARNEFEDIVREKNVIEKLNQLEDLVGEAKRRKANGEGEGEVPVPPHTLPPLPLINAHLNPLHISQQSQLNARLQTTQSQNATLIESIRKQKQEIEELVKMAEKVVGDLEDAGSRLGKEGEVLAKDSRSTEEVLGGV